MFVCLLFYEGVGADGLAVRVHWDRHLRVIAVVLVACGLASKVQSFCASRMLRLDIKFVFLNLRQIL